MKEVFKCRDRRVMRWVEERTKAQAWGCPCITPRNIQELQASKLGDAPEVPLLHRQKSGHLSRYYIFIASCIMHFSWSISFFSFQFSLLCCNKWLDLNKFPLDKFPCFSFAKNTPFFILIISTSVLLFLELRLVFDFRLNMRSDLVISFYQGVFLPLIFIGFYQKRCL
jgi:hypothetical protein